MPFHRFLFRAFILSAFLIAFNTAGAQTWERVDPAASGLDPDNQRGFAGIAAEGDRVLASQRAVSDNGVPIHELFLSTDGGVTWASLPTPGGGAHEDVEIVDGRLFTYSTAGHIYYSDDDGASWTKASGFSPFGNGLYEFRLGMSAGDALIGSNSAGAYRSTDGGASWVALAWPTPDYGAGVFSPGRGSDAVETATGAILLSDFNAGIYRTTDGGATWTQPWVSPGFLQGILHLTLRPNGSILAHVNSDPRSTLISTDDGATWTETGLIILSAAELRGADEDRIVWAGGDDDDVQLLEGDTVTDFTGDLTCPWQTAITTTHLVATTRCATTEENASHGIYRRALGETSTAAEDVVRPVRGTLEVWPNPVVESALTARLTTVQSGPVVIRLFDALGREVYRDVAVLTAGHPTELALDAAQFASGLYVVQIEGVVQMSRPVVIGR